MSREIPGVQECRNASTYEENSGYQETTDFQARNTRAEPVATTAIFVTCDFQSSMRRRLKRISSSRRAATVESRAGNSTAALITGYGIPDLLTSIAQTQVEWPCLRLCTRSAHTRALQGKELCLDDASRAVPK